MDAENYVIQYPLDAVHVDKFADLLGNPNVVNPPITPIFDLMNRLID